ncbi:TIR domain-containing protein [Piscinibacter sp.]|uniref:TIR domain-containing protein n=1 Tax=Piscinibacter sp. TaxID=1903157 RepID=UPI0039E5E3E9
MPPPASVAAPPARGVLAFISYAHADEELRAKLRVHLAALEREGLIQAWDDREILAGDAWADEIDARLNRADLVLLLVSADFINSKYCYGKELVRALERNADPKDRAIVIPIILRPCDWQKSRFAHLQALPTGGRPMPDWPTPDHYFTDVVKGLRECLQKLIFDHNESRGDGPPSDPPWWQQPRVWASALACAAVLAGSAAWAWRAAVRADHEVSVALQALRSGRAADAVSVLGPVCRSWVKRGACFALTKAGLVAELPGLDGPQLARWGARVDELKALAPDDPDLLFMSAQVALHEAQPSRYAQAVADLQRALTLTGQRYPEVHFALANLLMRDGRFADALQPLDRALDPAINPIAPAHYLNARAYARARSGDFNGAIHDYERSIEQGSILSRIELAELLWTRSEFERASDQLRAAAAAVADTGRPQSGSNALPWSFATAPGDVVVLRQPFEKRCFARWMERAGLALAGRPVPAEAPGWDDCGAEATRIAATLAASLQRAAGAGMNDTGRERLAQFMRQYRL